MLKCGTSEQIQQMFERLRKESRNLLKEIVELAYFMRGAVQYHAAFNLTPPEREVIAEFIKNRLEHEADRANPVY